MVGDGMWRENSVHSSWSYQERFWTQMLFKSITVWRKWPNPQLWIFGPPKVCQLIFVRHCDDFPSRLSQHSQHSGNGEICREILWHDVAHRWHGLYHLINNKKNNNKNNNSESSENIKKENPKPTPQRCCCCCCWWWWWWWLVSSGCSSWGLCWWDLFLVWGLGSQILLKRNFGSIPST